MNLYECKIMIVDDEIQLRQMVFEFLKVAGFKTIIMAGDCKSAKALYKKERPQLVILDINLPDGDGFSLFEKLQDIEEVPVIFLSARDEDDDRLTGLGLGADDYIVKPFLPRELILRIRAVLKRVYKAEPEIKTKIITLGKTTVDLGSGEVHREDKEWTLTAKEYAIMQKLHENKGQIITIDQLCEAVWKEENYGYENTLIVHIRRLREKIEDDPSHPSHLLTVRGLGYKLV